MGSSSPDPASGEPARPDPAAPGGAAALPNLRHLRLLEAASRLGSLGRAAAELHLSQPAASQGLARLARIFGAPLLERAGNGVAPTAAGRIVTARACRALEHLREAGRRLAPRARPAGHPLAERFERQATIPQLRALAAFAGTGSFAAAARGLGQTEPAVQRAARAAERLVGVALFEPARRGAQLTPAGEVLAAQAGLALQEIAAAHAELRERAGLYDGRVVIGTLPLVRTRILPEAVVALLARHPAARVEIRDGSWESLVQELRRGACDLIAGALRGPCRLPRGLVETPLFADRLAIVARAGHPLAGRPLAGPELAAYPWVLPRRDTPGRAVFAALAAARGVMRPGAGHVETGSLVALRGILLSSDAVALISPRQVDHEIRQGLIVTLGLPVAGSERAIGITTRADWAPTALQAAFLECLRAAAAAGA